MRQHNSDIAIARNSVTNDDKCYRPNWLSTMTPEEIVAEIHRDNRAALFARPDHQSLDAERVLALMNAAAMRGFQLGTNVAMSMIQGTLLVQIVRTLDTDDRHHPER
jgi:hypothetical protein